MNESNLKLEQENTIEDSYDSIINDTVKEIIAGLKPDLIKNQFLTEKFWPQLIRNTITNTNQEDAEHKLVDFLERKFPEQMDTKESLIEELELAEQILIEQKEKGESTAETEGNIKNLEHRIDDESLLNDKMMKVAHSIMDARELVIESLTDDIAKEQADKPKPVAAETKPVASAKEKKGKRKAKKIKNKGQKKNAAITVTSAQEAYETEQEELGKIEEAAESTVATKDKVNGEAGEGDLGQTPVAKIAPTVKTTLGDITTKEILENKKQVTIDKESFNIKIENDEVTLTPVDEERAEIKMPLKMFRRWEEQSFEAAAEGTELKKILDKAISEKTTSKEKVITTPISEYYGKDAANIIEKEAREHPENKSALLRLGALYFMNK